MRAKASLACVVGALGLGALAWGLTRSASSGLIIALVAGVALGWPLWLFRRLQAQQRDLRRFLQKDAHALADVFTRLGPEALPLPELGGIRVSADFAALLVGEISTRRPRVIAEFGCGASTLLAACALRRNGAGKIFSFDHEEKFAAETRAEVAARGLGEWAEVAHAPLKPGRRRSALLTYDPALVERLANVELAVVDGPPCWVPGADRGVVMDALAPLLAPGARVLFDDGGRDSITGFVLAWTKDHPGWTATRLDFEKGAWVLEAPGK